MADWPDASLASFNLLLPGVRMELWIVIALLICALTATLLALVRQWRLTRALRRLVIRLVHLWRSRHA